MSDIIFKELNLESISSIYFLTLSDHKAGTVTVKIRFKDGHSLTLWDVKLDKNQKESLDNIQAHLIT